MKRTFGYGEVVGVERERSKVVVFLDGGERTFPFPSAFYQGLLTV